MLKPGIQALFGEGKIESPAILAAIGDFNFLYFSRVLLPITVLVITVTSYISSPPNVERIRGLTYTSIDRAAVRESWDSRDVVATAIVLSFIATVYVYFSFRI